MIATFGEEFGWRGYLLPRLMPLGGFWAALLVGLIWGLWHAPIIFLDGYEYNDPHSLGAVLMFLLFTIPTSFIFTWLRNRTQSIWPTVLAHAVINSVASTALLFVVFKNVYLGSIVGLLGIIPLLAFAAWLTLTKRLELTQPDNTTVEA